MDLAYGPGELDYKDTKGSSSNMKREHDSVDDFEHLEPEASPVLLKSKDLSDLEKVDNLLKIDSGSGESVPEQFFSESSKNEKTSFLKDFEPSTTMPIAASPNVDLSDFHAGSGFHESTLTPTDKTHQGVEKSNMLGGDFGGEISHSKLNENKGENDDFNSSFISSEKHGNIFPDLGKEQAVFGGISNTDDFDFKGKSSQDDYSPNKEILNPEVLRFDAKSMKEDDALAQYNTKYDKKENEFDFEDEPKVAEDYNSISTNRFEPEPFLSGEKQEIKSDADVLKPKPDLPKPELKQSSEIFKMDSTKSDISTIIHEDNPVIPTSTNKPTPTLVVDTVTKPVTKSAADLDDIIGPEDVFKKIGLDAWFTPDRLHPTVEALVYWRDPKKSGVVFGGVMAVLLSLCYMSLISVVAYTSLLALTGTICFRIYKNILQAVQKTSDGHPFKEFLDFDLSLPQDKVRETADNAVVHINAALVELRRLFLVEDLIDSIKFAVCLWCLTYVGAIFNGMTLVILAFVALFTVPKIYENNKASIDQYIDIGRSKVAEITSKVKAALPVGKKEPEKDKEQ